jgi:hypothetical protein
MQGTQIAIAQFSVIVVKHWILQGDDSDQESGLEQEGSTRDTVDVAGATEGNEKSTTKS